ncbi:heterokaryon incompatibility protein-domain-containing protein [Podospora fimiseda]|uniref:Heterokaryon incompatibility protein-domain-containing protein n=1 Tax=Podospora fimiseda TaxID=252190 RepID=A0AAN7BMC4_9PEZI|nr:heterokaryon incompatibility protein-domain-containing protein [Podospora fimiseda]
MESVSANQPFQYPPLGENEFRTLIILPAGSGAPISCALETLPWKNEAPASHRVPYEALPYVWGPPSHLQSPGPRRVWIDAVCINQQNPAEKAIQLRKMNRVFADAKQVIIWLGEGDGPSRTAFQFARLLSEKLPESGSYFLLKSKRAWFQRAWAVQEITVAKTAQVLCGDSWIPWEKLEKVILFAMGDSALDHDKVYSVLALAPPDFTRFISINYDQPVEQLFISVARYLIERETLGRIFYSYHFPWSLNLPSWVPDLRQPNLRRIFWKPEKHRRPLKPNAVLTPDGSARTNWVFGDSVLKDLFNPIKSQWSFSTLSEVISQELVILLSLFPKAVQIKISPESINPEWHLKTHAPPRHEYPIPWNDNGWSNINFHGYLGCRTIVRTSDSGLLAWAPNTAQVGDIVYCIQGCFNLALLRPTEEKCLSPCW